MVKLGYVIKYKWESHEDYENRIYDTEAAAEADIRRWGGSSMGNYTLVEVFAEETGEHKNA